MIRARIKKWLRSFGAEHPDAMRSRSVDDGRAVWYTPADAAETVAHYRALSPAELEAKNVELRAADRCPRLWQVTTVPVDVEAAAALVPVCTCQADNTGAYAGMQPLGGRLMMVGFRCQHGAVWGEEMTKEEAQKFHPKEEPVSTPEKPQKPESQKPESLFAVHRLNEEGMVMAKRLQNVFEKALEGIEAICGSAPSREMSIVRTKLEEAAFFAKKAMAVKPENQE